MHKKQTQKTGVRKGILAKVSARLGTQETLCRPLQDARRERFCQAMLTASSATLAAVAAGYAPASAANQACRLMKNDDVRRRLAGLFANTAHRNILRKRDLLVFASIRASASFADFMNLINLPWDTFAKKIKNHPAARAIKSIRRGLEWDPSGKRPPVAFVKKIELFDPCPAEKLLVELLGWDAPTRVDLVDTYKKGRVILPVRTPLQVGALPEGFSAKDGGAGTGGAASGPAEGDEAGQ